MTQPVCSGTKFVYANSSVHSYNLRGSSRTSVVADNKNAALHCDSITIVPYNRQKHLRELWNEFNADPTEIRKFVRLFKPVFSRQALDAALKKERNRSSITILCKEQPVGAITSYVFSKKIRGQFIRGTHVKASWIGKRHRRQGVMHIAREIFNKNALTKSGFIRSEIHGMNIANFKLQEKIGASPTGKVSDGFCEYLLSSPSWKRQRSLQA